MSAAKTPGEIFKEARLKKGLTQIQVAEKAGMNSNNYAKIERGVTKPAPKSIKRLVSALDIDPSFIPNLLG
jgi:transcriptional regulator with XRE-family HTH domain